MAQGNEGWTGEAISFNWDDVSDAPPPPVEDGLYRAKFVSVKVQKTKGNDKNPPTPALNLQVEFVSPFAGGELGAVSKTAYEMLVMNPKMLWRVKGVAKRLNVNLPTSDGFDDLTSFGRDLIEAGEFIVRTKKEERNGKFYATIAAYLTSEEASEGASTGAVSTEPTPQRRRRGAAPEAATA
jgi:hypothetical protein